jgi:hypothetical protein
VLINVLQQGKYDIAKVLLKRGYDINMIDFRESYQIGEPLTLLDVYEYTEDTKGIEWLIRHGAKTAEDLDWTMEMVSRLFNV